VNLFAFQNRLSVIPNEIGELSCLKDLELWSNQISELPSTIGKLTNLNNLPIYDNSLEYLPSQIGNLNNLKVLYVYNNQLKKLPREIGKLKKLTRLNVQYNELEELPREIGGLESLRELEVSNNRLTSLPCELGLLQKLSIILFHANNYSPNLFQINTAKELMRYLKVMYDIKEKTIIAIVFSRIIMLKSTEIYCLAHPESLPVDIFNLQKLIVNRIIELYVQERNDVNVLYQLC